MIRPYDPATDHAYVAKTWAESFKSLGPLGRSMSPTIYQRRYTPVIDILLAEATTLLIVDDPSPLVILGFICHDKSLLHYLHVRDGFRGEGRARQLLKAIPSIRVYSHRTTDWQEHGSRLSPDATYDPAYALRHMQAD